MFSFILFKLLAIRKQIKHDALKEYMSNISPDYRSVESEVNGVAYPPLSANPGNMHVQKHETTGAPATLKEFCVKASYNSAYSGGFISDTMVKYVLSRGCRFLDFEVYSLPADPSKIDGDTSETAKQDAYVGYSETTDEVVPTNKNSDLAETKLSSILVSTLSAAFNNGGGNYMVSNQMDPLFIRLRLKCLPEKKAELTNIATNAVVYACKITGTRRIGKKIDGNMRLGKLKRKVILLMNSSKETEASNVVNILVDSPTCVEIKSEQINISKYPSNNAPRIIGQRSVEINNRLNIVVPPSGSGKNANIKSATKDYGCQFICQKYYSGLDPNMKDTEDMFSESNAGIIPLAAAINYAQTFTSSTASSGFGI